MPRTKGPRCGIEGCPSRTYHPGDDGFLYCSNGHRQEGTAQTGEDEDAFNTQGKKTRRKREEKEVVYQHLSGRKAFELYLLCYQLILRKQCWWLVKTRGLPAELEIVVHDLWTLRLQNLKSRVEEDSDGETVSQLYSSQSEGETDTETEFSQRRGRKKDASPKLIDTLALCYMATQLLRLPITSGDLHEWASGGEITYHRAIKAVPLEMRERLPGQYHEALDPQVLLKLGDVHHAVVDLVLVYQRDFGMTMPALNQPLLTFRYMKELALPLEVYPAVQNLARLVGYTFTYPEDAKRRLRIIDFPEAQLIALVVVAVKLSYPFDSVRRYSKTPDEPAAAVIDWDAWVEARREYDRTVKIPGRLGFEDAMKTTEKDVFTMSDKQLDDYLNFYERTFADEDIRERGKDSDFRHALFTMFPTSAGESQQELPNIHADKATINAAKIKNLEAVQGALKPQLVITEDEAAQMEEGIRRPGSQYKQYRSVDELPEHARTFFEAAAKMAGLSLKSLVLGVFLTERKIRIWVEGEKRREAGFGAEDEVNGRESRTDAGQDEGRA